MPTQVDSLNIFRKHPDATMYWGFTVPLQEGESINPSGVTHLVTPSEIESNLVISDITFSGANVQFKCIGGHFHEHYIAQFLIQTTQASRNRTREFWGRIEIV